jgi:hypothetical protein
MVMLSTTSEDDLSVHNSELVQFSTDVPSIPERQLLKNPQQWFVVSEEGTCSCSFRHLYSIDLGFGEPVEWYPEELDEINATLEVIRIIRNLVNSGSRVDYIDAWEGGSSLPFVELDIDLGCVSNEAFRFYENHCFNFGMAD